MSKNYIEKFFLASEAKAMEEVMKELGISYTRHDNVEDPKTGIHCTTINFTLQGTNIISIHERYKEIIHAMYKRTYNA